MFGWLADIQLRWAWGQGSAELSVQFSDKVTKTVVSTTLQAVILLSFNTKPTCTVRQVLKGVSPFPASVMYISALSRLWKIRELIELTGVDMATMKNILGSMLFAKDLMVLKKTPKSKQIEEDHVIELDPAYRNPSNVRQHAHSIPARTMTHLVPFFVWLQKVTLPVVAIEDKKSAGDTVSEERLLTIDAALVRIMKTRKTLQHLVSVTDPKLSAVFVACLLLLLAVYCPFCSGVDE